MDPLPPAVDALVVGGGPAGLSAATWLGRHRRRTLVVDAGEPRNRFTERIHGVLGHEGGSPRQLLERGREGLAGYDHVDLHGGSVVDLRAGDRGFEVELDGHVQVLAKRLVIATGVRDELPDVDGFLDHYGTDVFHCPTCDGYEARGETVLVLGWGEHVPAFALELLDWASTVRVVTDADEADITTEQRRRLDDRGVEVVDGEVAALLGEAGRLEGVRLADGTVIAGSVGFFTIAHHPVVRLAARLGCELTAEGRIRVDEQRQTSVAGVYAAGDVTPGMQLVSVAAAEGTIAGVCCATSLHGQASVDASPAPAPDPDPLTPGQVPDA